MSPHRVPVLAAFLLTACRPGPYALEAALVAADREFARDSQVRRLDAWLQVIDDSGIVLQAKGAVSRGRPAVHQRLAPLFADSTFTLNWEPLLAGGSRAGDLGYTVGLSQSARRGAGGAAAIESGKYITIWRRQPDGTWKVVLHAGVTD